MHRPLLLAAALLPLLAVPGRAAPDADCPDGACALPPSLAQAPDEPSLAVLSPVPQAAVAPSPMAPRLDTLDGKTIALVGGSFMAGVTHPEIRRRLLAAHPSARVLLFDEVGSAGPYPAPGVVRREKEAFERRLRELGVDAVVSGNGGCGLCTPKEAGSCIAAEKLGIPSAMVAGPGFADQARASARAAGLPTLRVAVYPGAFAADSRETLLANAATILWPAIERALTAPFDAAETNAPAARAPDPAAPALEGPYDEVCRAMLDSGWTDGLPVVPPTPARVAEFLDFCDLPPETVVATIPPANRAATVRHVAVNGVLAGCPPEFMPLLVAFAKAMAVGDFRRTLASTHAWTPWCWLSGPAAAQLGLSSGQGEISDPRNAALGRFINLAMLNLGGYRIRENRMGTFGYLMPWCVAEDAAAAARAGWRPWHVAQGFAPSDTTLTAASAINWGNNASPATADPERIADLLARDAVDKGQMAFESGMPLTHRVILVTEGVARNLATRFRTRAALEETLVERARIPLAERAWANYWANPGSAVDPARRPLSAHARQLAESEGAARTPVPPWLAGLLPDGTDALETVPAMAPGRTAILVTGDPARNKFLTVPGGGFATVKVELPSAWDTLMAARGYAPLASFAAPEPAGAPPPAAEAPARPAAPARRPGPAAEPRRHRFPAQGQVRRRFGARRPLTGRGRLWFNSPHSPYRAISSVG